jgi:hypothetical protein
MPHSAPPDHQRQPDYIFVGVLCPCVLIIPVPVGAGVFSLQRLLQPADSVLFGPTPNGELMIAIPTILIGLLASFRVARTSHQVDPAKVGNARQGPASCWGLGEINRLAIDKLAASRRNRRSDFDAYRCEGIWKLLLRDTNT